MDSPENTERAITNGQSRESGNIRYIRRRKTTQNNMCWTSLYANKTQITQILIRKQTPKIIS